MDVIPLVRILPINAYLDNSNITYGDEQYRLIQVSIYSMSMTSIIEINMSIQLVHGKWLENDTIVLSQVMILPLCGSTREVEAGVK